MERTAPWLRDRCGRAWEFRHHVISWSRQTTTVHGFAMAAMSAATQLAQGVPHWVVIGGVAAAIVLLIMPGQGDLSGKVGQLVQDVGPIVEGRGRGFGPAQVGILARDGLQLAGELHPMTTVIPVTAPVPVGVPVSQPPAQQAQL